MLYRRGFNLVGIVMLLVLLGSVGIAYLIVRSAHRQTNQGSAIIAAMRSGTLTPHWRNQPQVQWYKRVMRAGAPRWRAVIHHVSPDGDFVTGGDVIFAYDPYAPTSWEFWKLSPDASSGWYEASNASIRLADGKVSVFRPDSKLQRTQGDAPENYIPEGTMNLACYLTARAGKPAQFRLILNSYIPQTADATFIAINVDNIVSTNTGWRVTKSFPGQEADETLFFDKTGRLLKIESTSTADRPVDENEVPTPFKDTIAKLIIALDKMDWNGP